MMSSNDVIKMTSTRGSPSHNHTIAMSQVICEPYYCCTIHFETKILALHHQTIVPLSIYYQVIVDGKTHTTTTTF